MLSVCFRGSKGLKNACLHTASLYLVSVCTLVRDSSFCSSYYSTFLLRGVLVYSSVHAVGIIADILSCFVGRKDRDASVELLLVY